MPVARVQTRQLITSQLYVTHLQALTADMTVNKGSVTFHQFLPFLNMKQIFLLNGKIDDSCLSSLSSCRLIHALGSSRSVFSH